MTCKGTLLHVVHSGPQCPLLINPEYLGKCWHVTPKELLASFLSIRPSYPKSYGNICFCSIFIFLTQTIY